MPPYIHFNLTARILIHPHKVVPKTGGVKDLDCWHIVQMVVVYTLGLTVSHGIDLINLRLLVK